MSRVLLGLALLLVGCGDSSGPSTNTSITGSWTGVATYNNPVVQTTCTFNGIVTLNQLNTTFTGDVTGSITTCNGPNGTVSTSSDGPISGGQVVGAQVDYSNGECVYTGTISGSPPNRMNGTVSCQVSVAGKVYPFTGTWQLSR